LIELPLIEQRMLSYSPSNIAASALYLARKILLRKEGNWTSDLQKHTGYTEE
jgi:cyclin B